MRESEGHSLPGVARCAVPLPTGKTVAGAATTRTLDTGNAPKAALSPVNPFEVQKELNLISAARDGDGDAYGQLVEMHQDRVFATLLRHVRDEHKARDLAQETFIQAFRAIHTYEDRAKFSTWLYRIALNLLTSQHRADVALKRGGGNAKASLDAEGMPEPDAVVRGPAENVAAAEIGVIVREAIETLDEEYKSVVILRDLQGLSYEEVAEVLGLAPGTVRSRLHRGREKLREKLRHLE
jgi:RNA polymerase sigma-70 factor, ECF subfamily